MAWVTNLYDDTVAVIDLAANRVVATVPVGDKPNGISFSAVPVRETVPKRTRVELPNYSGSATDNDDGHDDDH